MDNSVSVLIVEDEAPAARRLQKLVLDIAPTWHICAQLESIEETVNWLSTHSMPDLLFLDIQLADGLSFDIFEHLTISTPVIFTTAYDQYAIKAFEVNSVDYLLKPIEKEHLQRSLNKFNQLTKVTTSSSQTIEQLMQFFKQEQRNYKQRFLVKQGDRLISIEDEEIAYFISENKVTLLFTKDHKKFVIEYSIEQLSNLLNPKKFFRLNRKCISSFISIVQVHHYFNGKLKIALFPPTNTEILVSRDRSQLFKDWLDS